MRVLFDHATPAPLIRFLAEHSVTRAKDRGWDTLSNGDLLNAAEDAGFEVLVTTDKNIRFQQNLAERKIAIVVLGRGRWTLIKPYAAKVLEAINAAMPGGYIEVEMPHTH